MRAKSYKADGKSEGGDDAKADAEGDAAKDHRQRHERSFAKKILIPIEPLQARLEALFDSLFGKEGDDINGLIDSLARELDVVLNGQMQELHSLGAM